MIVLSLFLSSEDLPLAESKAGCITTQLGRPRVMIRISSSVQTLLPIRAREPQSNSVSSPLSSEVISMFYLGSRQGARGEKHQAPSAVMWTTVPVLDS